MICVNSCSCLLLDSVCEDNSWTDGKFWQSFFFYQTLTNVFFLFFFPRFLAFLTFIFKFLSDVYFVDAAVYGLPLGADKNCSLNGNRGTTDSSPKCARMRQSAYCISKMFRGSAPKARGRKGRKRRGLKWRGSVCPHPPLPPTPLHSLNKILVYVTFHGEKGGDKNGGVIFAPPTPPAHPHPLNKIPVYATSGRKGRG